MPCTPLFLFTPYQKPPFNVLRRWRNTKKNALIIGLRQRRDAKNRRRAVSYVSTGLACLPRDTNARTTTAEERLYMSPLDLPTNLYNRSSAVDSSFYNQPQVGEPTWGYNYPTALRRLPSVIGHHPHPQKTATIGLPSPLKKTPSIGLRQRRNAKNRLRHRFAPTAQCKKPPKSGFTC